LAAVFPTGEVAKCGLYAHRPLGRLEEGLETCWLRLTHHRVSDLTCAACEQVEECRGGCRFRAGEGLGPDPVMCARFGVDPAIF
jgi:radical SAM protein with 4Fe4S-binding SPASM domain